MPFIRLVLDSSYVKLSSGSFGQPTDGASNRWNDLTYNLYDFLPPQKITELLLSDRYKIVLESLVWKDRDGFTTDIEKNAFKVMLPNIMNESSYTNRASGNEGLLAVVFEEYSPNVYYHTGNEKGIVVYDKQWLRTGSIRVKFGKLHASDDAFENSDFGVYCKYSMSIIIEY